MFLSSKTPSLRPWNGVSFACLLSKYYVCAGHAEVMQLGLFITTIYLCVFTIIIFCIKWF